MRPTVLPMPTDLRPIRICGIELHRDAYDDNAVIYAYTLWHHQHLLTPLEHRVVCSIAPVVSDTPHYKLRQHYNALELTDGHVPDADVYAIYASDPEGTAFRERAIQRLVSEYSNIINRCPSCQRIARTPTAQLCPWCKHTWRDVPVA